LSAKYELLNLLHFPHGRPRAANDDTRAIIMASLVSALSTFVARP
jgi:hypothetical protein